MVESTAIHTVPPTFDNCMDALCSSSGWDRIDNMTENAQQAPAACTARLAPFGACCILHQNSGVESRVETDQIHKESRDGHPPGIRRSLAVPAVLCYRCCCCCRCLASRLDFLRVLFPLPYPSHGHPSPNGTRFAPRAASQRTTGRRRSKSRFFQALSSLS
jgi:hypothetical protein